MAVPFDHIDSTFNTVFTQSAIGQLQRKHAWEYLAGITSHLRGFEILALNPGSGDDALLFGERDFNIVATDVSSAIQHISQPKITSYSLQHGISTQYIDLENFNETLFHKKFDLVFSNFGGISSMAPASLQEFIQKVPSILSPGGHFVAVVMPRFCAWESLYFLYRLQFGKIFRRWTKKEVDGFASNNPSFKTWFYKPSDIISWSKTKFKVISIKPIGVALPPLCLENISDFRRSVLIKLNTLEEKFNRLPFFSRMSDHFLIDLQLV